MRGTLIFLGLIVAGFAAFLPLLSWAASLAFSFSEPRATVYLWVETVFYAYLFLPAFGLLLILFGLREDGEMERNRAIQVMVCSVLLGIIALVIPGLFFGTGPSRGIFALVILVPFLANLGTLFLAFIGAYRHLKSFDIAGCSPT